MPRQLTDEELDQLTPDERAAWLDAYLADWSRFAEDARASREEWQAYRAAGGQGIPPGWISAREYRRQRDLRSDL